MRKYEKQSYVGGQHGAVRSDDIHSGKYMPIKHPMVGLPVADLHLLQRPEPHHQAIQIPVFVLQRRHPTHGNNQALHIHQHRLDILAGGC